MAHSFSAQYSSIYTISTALLLLHFQLVAIMALMDFVMDNVREVSPINIIIDSSIDIAGNNITILLPLTAGSATNTKLAPSGESDDGTASSATAASAGQVRTVTIRPLAATIIAALRQAGGLSDAMGRTRPIQIYLNTGVRVGGNNNVVATGESVPRAVFTRSPSVAAGVKRRAESVCISEIQCQEARSMCLTLVVRNHRASVPPSAAVNMSG